MRPMLENLTAGGPHPDLPEKVDIYGRLIGSWQVANRQLDETTGQWRDNQITWHFGRILDGLGVQDVLRGQRGSGTTVRVYDRDAEIWRVTWYGPHWASFASLVGRPHGDEIRQDGTGTDGRPIRWNFTEIAPDSFRWLGYISDDEGASWRMEQEMRATRLAGG